MDTNYHIVSDCFHVYSDGTRVEVLFETEDDCVFGMNLLAVVAFQCGLTILCLEIMKTHFHIILKGNPASIQKFKGEVKRRLTKYFRQTGRSEIANTEICIEADPITTEDELRAKIIYVFRNCTEAGFQLMPEDYAWGPGHAFFHKKTVNYKRVSSLSYREQCRVFHTRVRLPGHWEFDYRGLLIPASYMDLDYFQQIFPSTHLYFAFLNVRKRDLAQMEADDARPFLERKDEDALRKEIGRYSKWQYGVPVNRLPESERVSVAVKMWADRKTYSVKQLARLTKLDASLLRNILHVTPR